MHSGPTCANGDALMDAIDVIHTKREGGVLDDEAIRWFQKRMGLQDWRFKVVIQDESPPWAANTDDLGGTIPDVAYKSAKIWARADRARLSAFEPLSTLFHEALHVSCHDAGLTEGNASEHTEFVLNRLGDLMAAAYRAGI